MNAGFFYYPIYDRFIQRQSGARVCVFVNFFVKKLLQTIDWIFTKFHRNVPEIEVKNFSSPLKKNQVCGAIQAL